MYVTFPLSLSLSSRYRGDSFIALSKVELGLADYSTAIECIRTQENSLSSSSASSSSPLSLPLPSSTSSPPQSAASDLLEGLPAMTTEAVEVAKYNVTQRIAKTSIEVWINVDMHIHFA